MRFYKGLSLADLNAMTLPQYRGLLDKVGDVAELESGKTDHRRRAEKMREERARRGLD